MAGFGYRGGGFCINWCISSAGEMLSPLKYGGFLRAVEYKDFLSRKNACERVGLPKIQIINNLALIGGK